MTTATHYQAVDRAFQIASLFMEECSTRPPRALASAEQLRQRFNIDLSEHGRPATAVINDLVSAAQGGIVGNTGPDFFGWVMGSSSPVGIAADILTSAWGQNAAIYQTAPAAAIAEETAAAWLLELLDLPRESSVGFTTGATMASYIGLAAARSEVLQRRGWDLEEQGLFHAPSIPVIVSEEAHTSILAVLRYLGFGSRQLKFVPTDNQGRMQLEPLEKAIQSQPGPGIIVAQAGHINSGAFDHIEAIAAMAQVQNAWLHIDGAFGLWARCSETVSEQALGIEKADSWAIDGHKWLQVPYDSGYAIVKDSRAHKRAMSMDASYLNRDDNDGRNPADFGPELSRRARGFTTWATLQCLGRRGIADMVDRHCACARKIARKLEIMPGVRLLNDVCLNQVAVTFEMRMANNTGTQNMTDRVIEELQRENVSFVSGADWRGTRVMRISVISGQTTEHNVAALLQAIRRAWQKVQIVQPIAR